MRNYEILRIGVGINLMAEHLGVESKEILDKLKGDFLSERSIQEIEGVLRKMEEF